MDYISITTCEKELLDRLRDLVRKFISDDTPFPELHGVLTEMEKVQEALDSLSETNAEAPSTSEIAKNVAIAGAPPITPQQAWEYAPEGATHLVQNENKTWCWLLKATEDPIAASIIGLWKNSTEDWNKAKWMHYNGPLIHFTGDWKDSLHVKGGRS